jgi:pumilio family protein 6
VPSKPKSTLLPYRFGIDSERHSADLDRSDTKLMSKAYITDIITLAPTLAFDKNARRVILYLLNPTSTRHNIPSTLSSLSASAQAARDAGTSKKDPVVRRKELLSAASPGLIGFIGEKGDELVRDPGAGLLVQEIMLSAEGGEFDHHHSKVSLLRLTDVK